MTAAALPGLRLGPRWERLDDGGHQVRLRFKDEVGVVDLGVRRSAEGQLRDSYPLSTHDIELYAVNDAAPQALTRALAELSQAALDADPLGHGPDQVRDALRHGTPVLDARPGDRFRMLPRLLRYQHAARKQQMGLGADLLPHVRR